MVAHALMMADHYRILGKEKVEKMDKELLKETFRAYKKASGVKYAITNPDSLGDCQSCVNYALSKKYGEDSKGIWAKHWTRGMNGDGDLADTDCVYIAHDITEELADTFYEVFGKAYNIFPSAYDPYTCFHLYEKDTPVYEVSYNDTWGGKVVRRSNLFTDRNAAINWMERLFSTYEGENRDICLKRMF